MTETTKRVGEMPDGQPQTTAFIPEDQNWRDDPVPRREIAVAINKAHARYAAKGDVEGALIFIALALCKVKPTPETLVWAAQQVSEIRND